MTNNQAWMAIIVILVIAFIVTKGNSTPEIPETNLSLIKAQLAHEIAYEHEKNKVQEPLKVSISDDLKVKIPELDLDYVYDASEVEEIPETISSDNTETTQDYEVIISGPGCTPKNSSCLICKANEKILIEAPELPSSETKKVSSEICTLGQYNICTTRKSSCSYSSYSSTCVGGFCRWRPLARIQAWRDRNRERRRNTFAYMRAR